MPTPLELLSGVDAGGDLWLKNDGVTAARYGGNKVRKLEQILPHALERNATRVVTCGAAGSHHALATAIYANELGLDAAAILTPQAWSMHAEDTLRAALGQGLAVFPVLQLAAVIPRWISIARPRDYWIAPGALGARGSLGYLLAMDELMAQIGDRSWKGPTRVIVAAGSGSTAAGLLVGLTAHGFDGRVEAVAVAKNPALRSQILAQAWALSRQRGLSTVSLARLSANLTVVTDQVGPGYGRPTEATMRARQIAERLGLELDVTYTARAFAHALRVVGHSSFADTPIRRPTRALYWHTLSTASMAPLLETAPRTLPAALQRLLLRGDAAALRS